MQRWKATQRAGIYIPVIEPISVQRFVDSALFKPLSYKPVPLELIELL